MKIQIVLAPRNQLIELCFSLPLALLLNKVLIPFEAGELITWEMAIGDPRWILVTLVYATWTWKVSRKIVSLAFSNKKVSEFLGLNS